MPSTTASPPSALGGSARARHRARRPGAARRGGARDRARHAARRDWCIQARSPFQGAKVANMSPALADELRLDTSSEGVVVVDVADGSPAQSLGFQRGDVVLSVNNQKIVQDPRPRARRPRRRAGSGGSPSGAAASRCSASCSSG